MEQVKAPTCVGIILDGNRRWAKAHGLPQLEGHRRGAEKLEESALWIRDRGVKHLVVYAFSTENWKRDEDEVLYLMNIFREFAKKPLRRLMEERVLVRFIGQIERLEPDLQKAIADIESTPVEDSELTLWICLSYGGRAEIVDAVKKTIESGEEITEKNLRTHFWSTEMPDPDLVIRTSGEKRISNFLIWQSAYSELFFLDTFWADFSEKILDEVLAEFRERKRRFGA